MVNNNKKKALDNSLDCVAKEGASSDDKILETINALPNIWMGLMGIFGGDLTVRMKQSDTNHSFNHSC